MGLKKKEKASGIVDVLKGKLIDGANDYLEKKIESSKKDFIAYAQKNFKRKIKKEVRSISYIIIFYFLIVLGMMFVFYGLIYLIVYLLNLPEFLVSIFYGLFLILISLIIYILK